jgi:lipopolysaccharide export system protein LptA
VKRLLSLIPWVLPVLLAAPAPLLGQERCNQVLPSDTRRVVTPAGHEIIYFRDPVRFICPDGVQIEADSAVWNSSANTAELVGQVLYRDGDRQLTSDWAHFVARSDELFARGSVVLTDRGDGSIITGDDFEYRRETAERPEAHMVMRGERPHAILPPTSDPAPGEEATPIRVWAQRLEMRGDREFIARTDVEIERADLRGEADEARFDHVAERIILTGRAHVETDEYRLDGNRIEAHVRADTLREVLSERDARLVAEELTVFGHTIRIGFVDGQPERVEAWNPAASPSLAALSAVAAEDPEDPGAPEDVLDPDARAPETPAARPEAPPPPSGPRAVAISQDFELRADSIDARSQAGRLREVRAVGRAYGERQADTLASALPDVATRDWIQGDTITGYFMDAPMVDPDPEAPAMAVEEVFAAGEAAETEANETVLERIEVVGGSVDALSLYRTEAPEGGAQPALNFMRAKRITLFMSDGEVSRVEADGPIEGLYLDPAQSGRAQPPGGGAGQGARAGR